MRYTQGYGQGGGMKGNILDEFKNAFSKPDNGLIQIILINLTVFVTILVARVFLMLSGGAELYHSFLQWFMLPAAIPEFLTRPWTLISYFFLHEGFIHILFNMLFLYWFGKIIKEFMGGGKLVSLYVLGGIAGGLFYLLIYNTIPFFHERVATSVMLGASGAVFAVVVGAATLMPNYTMFLLFLGPVRIKYIALFYVFLSFAQSTGSNAGGELAHLGGAAIGYFYIVQIRKGTDWGKWIHYMIAFFKSFFKKQSKVKVSYRRKSSARTTKTNRSKDDSSTGKASQDEIDTILDKISQSGYESLTKEEKQKLFNASSK
jgi:membrane associated rhomboid family serine protease